MSEVGVQTDLAAWLLAQVDEDERDARQAVQETTGRWSHRDTGWGGRYVVEDDCGALILGTTIGINAQYPHIARHNPARVLAECDTKRRIIALHKPTQPYPGDELTYPSAANLCQHCGPGDNWEAEQEPFGEMPCDHLRLLALPYADRPGYRPEWRP